MNQARRRDDRTKLRLLLTPSELRKLDAAVHDTGTNRSLIILEAVKVGLTEPHPPITQERRNVRVDAWVTDTIKQDLRQLAANLNVTQQHLTRHLLLAYLTSSSFPLSPNSQRNQSEPSHEGRA